MPSPTTIVSVPPAIGAVEVAPSVVRRSFYMSQFRWPAYVLPFQSGMLPQQHALSHGSRRHTRPGWPLLREP